MESRKYTYESIKPKLSLNNIPIKKEPISTSSTPPVSNANVLTVDNFITVLKNCKKIDTDLSYDKNLVVIFDRLERELKTLSEDAGEITVEVVGTKTHFRSRNRLLRKTDQFVGYIEVSPNKLCKVILPSICNICEYVNCLDNTIRLQVDDREATYFEITSPDRLIEFTAAISPASRDSSESE